MRIAGGNLRGRRLTVPAGGIRPTSVRVREALFDILSHGNHALDLSALHVLDAFAGTGALGLEAHSRGARHVTFMDSNRTAIRAIRSLIEQLGAADSTTVLAADATRPPPPTEPCQLLLLDPPYRSDLAAPAITALDHAGWLAAQVTILVECAAKAGFVAPSGFHSVDRRTYGGTALIFLRRAVSTS